MADTTRVKCNVCANEDDGKCALKGCKIAKNKKRICKTFAMDNDKASVILAKKLIADQIPSEMRPDWYFDKNKRREITKEIKRQVAEQIAKAEGLKAEKAQVDFTNPDCLANIRSTVSE